MFFSNIKNLLVAVLNSEVIKINDYIYVLHIFFWLTILGSCKYGKQIRYNKINKYCIIGFKGTLQQNVMIFMNKRLNHFRW